MKLPISNEDLKLFAMIMVLFSLIVYIVIPQLNTLAQSNYFSAYIAFTVVYTIFLLFFVFKSKITLGRIIGLVFLFIAGDIIMPPLLVTTAGIVSGLPVQAQFSSDIFVYSTLPDFIPAAIKYFLTYVLIPAIMIVLARHLLSKQIFKSELF